MKLSRFLIKQAGFTLIEMLVVISIAAILSVIAVPSFKTITQDAAINKANSNLLDGLTFARSEAVSGNQSVMFCPSSDGLNCLTSVADWSKGWLVWVNSDANQTHDAGEQVLRVGSALPSSLQMIATAGIGTLISFDAQGVTNVTGTFTFCDSRGASYANAVVIYIFGGVQPTEKQHDGAALTCAS